MPQAPPTFAHTHSQSLALTHTLSPTPSTHILSVSHTHILSFSLTRTLSHTHTHGRTYTSAAAGLCSTLSLEPEPRPALVHFLAAQATLSRVPSAGPVARQQWTDCLGCSSWPGLPRAGTPDRVPVLSRGGRKGSRTSAPLTVQQAKRPHPGPFEKCDSEEPSSEPQKPSLSQTWKKWSPRAHARRAMASEEAALPPQCLRTLTRVCQEGRGQSRQQRVPLPSTAGGAPRAQPLGATAGLLPRKLYNLSWAQGLAPRHPPQKGQHGPRRANQAIGSLTSKAGAASQRPSSATPTGMGLKTASTAQLSREAQWAGLGPSGDRAAAALDCGMATRPQEPTVAHGGV